MMARSRSLLLVAAVFAPVMIGCGGDDEVVVPEGVECGAVLPGGSDAASLKQALADAVSGDCVVLEGVTYQGSFEVKASVRVVAAEGASPKLQGSGDAVTITLHSGAGTLLRGAVVVGGKTGVFLDGTEGKLQDVTVMNAADIAVAAVRDVSLGGPDTMPAQGISLANVDLHASGTGLFAKNVRVNMDAGIVHENVGESLTSGIGIAALGGTQLVAIGTIVQANGYGVVVDGALTTAKLVDAQVLDQSERGIWAQMLTGSAAAPALTIEGASTNIENNALTGLGAVESTGILVTSARIAGTLKKPIVSDIGTTVEIGDGVGLFSGTGDVKLDGVTLENNQRCQAIVDDAATGIAFVSATVSPSGDQLGVVVQNTQAEVSVPADVMSDPGQPLELSAPVVPLSGP